jgi:predicted secreted acid phosphatase
MTHHARRVTVLLMAVAVLASLHAPAQAERQARQAQLPNDKVWRHDVTMAMDGSLRYLKKRVARGGKRLAVNLDIDNTAMASHYGPGDPVRKVLRFARKARSLGVHVLFNTGRLNKKELRASTRRQLDRNGYEVAELCMRKKGERKAAGKQRCRRQFVADGYTIIANVGNLPTDFVGGDYERAFRLPHYDEQLN